MKIEIEEKTFKRLGNLAVGFDTPDAVINRLIDKVEDKKDVKPILSFTPTDEKNFIRLLVRDKIAEVVLYKSDGSRTISEWRANKLTEQSNLRGNLWSGFLRGWKEKEIISAEFRIYPKPSTMDEKGDFERTKVLALELGLTFEEMLSLDGDYEIDENASADGLVYDYVIRFFDTCDQSIISKVNGLDNHNQVRVSSSVFAH